MNIKRSAVATIAAATMLTGVGFGATTASAAPHEPKNSITAVKPKSTAGDIPVSVTIDPVALTDTIKSIADANNTEEGFVKAAMYEAAYNIGQQKYNVCVLNIGNDGIDTTGILNSEGDKAYTTTQINSKPFGVFLFRGGATVTNTGEKGWKNWGCIGLLERPDDDHIVFSAQP